MSFEILEELTNALPSERAGIITALYEKNRMFFSRNFPRIDRFLDMVSCPYQIDITDRFLDIVHTDTGRPAHAGAGIDRLARSLSDRGQGPWIDLEDFLVRMPPLRFLHGRMLKQFNRSLLRVMPDMAERIDHGFLERSFDLSGRFYSPPVVFAGIFHGLHIACYLAENHPDMVMLVEPEPERFMVSCYFLDYQEIYAKCSRVFMVLDDAEQDSSFRDFFAWHHVTPQVWTRVLPGYASELNARIITKLELFQKVHLHNNRPFDIELEGLSNCVRNIREKNLLLSRNVQLSRNSSILVVGSGPSLENDISWIKKNRDRVIIFAVHSATAILRAAGVRPDFQFSSDIHLDVETVGRLGLDPSVPLVTLCKANRAVMEAAERVCLVETDDKVRPVEFSRYVGHVLPTTGNLAVGFAAFLRPGLIILAGMDLGFRKEGKRHAAGGFFGSGKDRARGDSIPVPASLDPDSRVLTTSFLNQARLEVEAALAAVPGCRIINISDGARIKGTLSIRSSELKLPGYPERHEDIRRVLSVFSPAKEGVNWRGYRTDGRMLLKEFKEMIVSGLSMDEFDLAGFSSRLDSVLGDTVTSMLQKDGGARMELYLKLVLDLLAVFYRFLLFARDDAERLRIYSAGMYELANLLEQLEWPDELQR